MNLTKTFFVICGGPGEEHAVSLASGDNIYNAAHSLNVPCEKIVVAKDGSWVFGGVSHTEEEGLTHIASGVIFPIIHGTYGEDGTLQALLEARNIPYVGASSAVMRLTIDKRASQEHFSKHNILVPRTIVATKENYATLQIPFTYPVIVKPINEGSSVSVHKVADEEALRAILHVECDKRREMLVQEFVSGREFTCGVVELNGSVTTLAPTEVILTKGELFDYTAKYTPGGCTEVTPAQVTKEERDAIQTLALQTHTVSGCKDISRTDMILNKQGDLVVLEINTLPGMTNTSFIPAELIASGYSTEVFVKSMVEKYM